MPDDRSLTAFFMDFKGMYEELNALMPISDERKVNVSHREQMATMSFLTALSPRFSVARSQILSGAQLPSLEEAFSRVLRTERTSLPAPIEPTSALLSHSQTDNRGPPNHRGSTPRGPNQGAKDVICYYCKEPGHTKRTCRKLQNKQNRQNSAHVAATANDTVTISAAEYAQLKSVNPPVSAGIVTGNEATALVSSSSKWIIDSGATDHMTGNRYL